MDDPRDYTTATLRTRALEILGGDPADRALWETHYLEIFGLVTSTREPRHHWPLETRVLLSLRTTMRYEL